MAKFNGNKSYTTVWLKPKTKTVKGGKELTLMVGHLDTGGGKMLEISVYADSVEPVTGKNDEEIFGVSVRKWKGSNSYSKSRTNKTW